MDLISLVIVLIVIGLILWLLTQLPIDPTLAHIIRVVILIAVILWLARVFLGPTPVVLRR